jgi:hypothetical protein
MNLNWILKSITEVISNFFMMPVYEASTKLIVNKLTKREARSLC